MRKTRRLLVTVGLIGIAALTILLTYKLSASENTEQRHSATEPGRKFPASTPSGAPISLRNSIIKVEDQSGRPGVRSKDFTETVLGIDSDRNGIRDDIQNYIEQSYKDPAQRQAMLQYTRAAELLYFSETFDVVKRSWPEYARSSACLRQAFGRDKWTKEAGEITAQLLNTPPRIEVYITYNRLAAGHIYDLYGGTQPCDR